MQLHEQEQETYFRLVPSAGMGIVIHHPIMPSPSPRPSEAEVRAAIAASDAGQLLPHTTLSNPQRLSLI